MATHTTYPARTYHNASSPYVLPNDHSAQEQSRLDKQASAIEEMIGGRPFLFDLRLLPSSPKMLDVGCGTGVATLQLAKQVPLSEQVYGIDLSSVPEPTKAAAPKNVTFIQGNFLDGEDKRGLSNGSFDYVFGRMLFLAIDDWPGYFKRVNDLLKPGGIVEHQDCSWEYYRQGTFTKLSDNWAWHRAVLEESAIVGLDICAADHLVERMEGAGFEVLSTRCYEFSMVPSEKSASSMAEI
ncbi:methyltransferase domain-containing protein [Colletotrichum paranaense]|uniref:Methyltransferase domain-containing protein n=1 Tax=Colletotrichum paranaense TaxID=1914294 RepID=A0ABQ9SHW4_9PEZI|nr:methyltransferase domain-containing protein [Colletotrichum paranaense]KAK1537496.1 methyltransferase domain-containing protein [Colletotrichum paranaense]